MIISKTHFFLLLYQSGKSLTSTIETKHKKHKLLHINIKHKLHTVLCKYFFDNHNRLGFQLLRRLHLGLSHHHELILRHCFQNNFNPLCEYGKDIESKMHFFLHCTNFLIPRPTHLQKIWNIDDSILF